MIGENHAHVGLKFDHQKLLIDPYAKALNRSAVWNKTQYKGDSQFMIPKGIVQNSEGNLKQTPKPQTPLDQTVIYETHVKGLTQLHPSVPDQYKGKFLGVCQPAIVNHLKSLGITAIQLMPVAAFMPEPYITNKGLTNYWGYNPINYFSPDPRYAIDDGVAEFKTMTQTLHEAGIEVILDVVYNHTAEGGIDGPLLSFKGFDNSSCYLFERNEYGAVDYNKYVNNSGCGNSVNTAFPYVLKMVMDALRYWTTEMGVDGFRFDLAASLGRDPYEFSTLSGFFRTIRQDPVLVNTKLIAEPWDIGHGGYRLGQFPSNWLECNDKYRDTVRAYWRGDKGLVSDFATRLLGSRDVFPKAGPFHSYVGQQRQLPRRFYLARSSELRRDGTTKRMANKTEMATGIMCRLTMVSKAQPLMLQILAMRERQKRNLFATLMLSQGIPHMCLAATNSAVLSRATTTPIAKTMNISWLDWTLNQSKQDFLTFCQQTISLRKSSEILNHLNLKDDRYLSGHNVEKINWYRPDGARKLEDDWQNHDNQSFALELCGPYSESQSHHEHWLLVFNASEHDVHFHLPDLGANTAWKIMLDTRYARWSEQPNILIRQVHMQAFRSICVFKCSIGD